MGLGTILTLLRIYNQRGMFLRYLKSIRAGHYSRRACFWLHVRGMRAEPRTVIK